MLQLSYSACLSPCIQIPEFAFLFFAKHQIVYDDCTEMVDKFAKARNKSFEVFWWQQLGIT